MASAFAHGLVGYSAAGLLPLQQPWRISMLAILWSIAPDIDSLGFFWGIPYSHIWGHRGLSHSLLFAVITSTILTIVMFRQYSLWNKNSFLLILFFSLVMISHGILDAMTTGGLGIAFFAPFDHSRYFLPWRPIIVSPIGIRSFFGEWGQRVLLNEIIWVGIPCSVLLLLTAVRRYWKRRIKKAR